MLTLRNAIFSDGERFCYLEGKATLPDYWTTLFVTIELRPKLAQNTILSILVMVRNLKLWELQNGRNLISEFAAEKFLTSTDTASLYEHFTLRRSEVERQMQVQSSNDVVTMQVQHPLHVSHLETVGTHQQRQRMNRAALFLTFVGKTIHRHSSRRAFLYSQLEKMKAEMKQMAPRVLRSTGMQGDPNYRSAPPEVYDEVMRQVHVDSPNNPFRRNVRLRNQVMYNILYETGARGGEILGLRIEDIDWTRRVLKIVRRHDDLLDCRKHQPVAKTEEGEVYISETLARDLRQYIMEDRAKIGTARTHPYIFVNHRKGVGFGNPVSTQTFKSRIIKPVSLYATGVFKEITRHGFRHNFNYRLSKKIDTHNALAANDPSLKSYTEKEETHVRMRLNRWRSEATAQVYNLRYIKEKADRLMQAQLDEIAQFKGSLK